MRIIILIFTLHIFVQLSCAQIKVDELFEEGSRICFVGNSITYAGGFHHNIMLYQMTRFPQKQVIFYNCGIGGNQACDVLKRMDYDILVHNPTHAIIMLGMNDVHRGLYGANLTTDEDTLKKRKEAIETYKSEMDSIVKIFLSQNINVILQKPSIYDQTSIIPEKNHYGVNDALKKCADLNQELASKYNLQTIDYWTIMGEINQKVQKEDRSLTIVGKDRVHPGTTGHLIMAYQFLKTIEAPHYVSKIVIDNNKTSALCQNCNVTNIINKSEALSFNVYEYALPFPVTTEQEEGLRTVPFIEDLNMELLQVMNLKHGQYQLSIDDSIVGTFSAKQFEQGINLTEFKNTPQYCQAKDVLAKLQELWRAEKALRNITYMEHTSYFNDYSGDKSKIEELRSYLNMKFKPKGVDRYLFDEKQNQEKYEHDFVTLRKEAFQLAQPKEHSFTIKKI